MADWEHPYLTMDFKYEANIVRSLAKITSQGHLQKGSKPVHWCLDCASALAEAEVEYAMKTSPSIDVRFIVTNSDDFWRRMPDAQKGTGAVSIPIWTTTPWTLPANQAVALNPCLQYALVDCGDEQMLIAQDLVSSVLERYQIDKHRLVGHVRGEHLEGVKLKHPFYDRLVPVVLGEHVTIESGTGAVHTAPAHGLDDYVMGQQYQLPLENPVGDDGRFIRDTPIFAGLHVNEVNDQIIDTLKTNEMLICATTISHSYPHCWRHKTPIIFRATPQWFISMDQHGLRNAALASVNRVKWIPEWGQSRMEGMIADRPDWCISRQRAWGVPLCLFVHKETGELHPNALSLMEQTAKLIEQNGIEAWFDLDPKNLLGDEANDYRKTTDVLDVWFDSGVSHECVLKQRSELSFPADIVLEGSDQHRGWFQSSLLSSVAMNGVESYKAVLTHGFVVDGQGRKMSKSLGNVIAPEEVIKTLGADILRLWVGSIDYRNEISASKEILTRISEAYRRIRNTARFMLSNLHDFKLDDMVPYDQLLALDQYAIHLTKILQDEIITAYDAYQFHVAMQRLHHFCVVDMGGFYLDIIKDRLYTMPQNSLGRRSAQTVLFHLIHSLVRWMAPVLSFTAEEIWQYMPEVEESSVFLTTWYQALKPLANNPIFNVDFWQKIRLVREAVNKELENARRAEKIGSALEAQVTLYCGPNLRHQLDALENELRFLLITASAKVIAEHAGPLDTLATDVPALTLKIEPTTDDKCERCWHRCASVNKNNEFAGLCARCVTNLKAPGEIRKFA